MKTIKFNGTHYEIGLKQGKFYKKEKLKLRKKIDKKLLDKQIEIYKKFYPEHLEKLKGISDAMKEPLEKVQFNFIAFPLQQLKRKIKRENGCTIFGIKTNETTIVGRNYDWVPITRRIFEINTINLHGKIYFIAVSDMGIWKNKKDSFIYDIVDAINKEGLYIGLTFAYDNHYNYGVWPTDMISLIAENCKNIKEVKEKFKKIPLACPKNFFIADKKGEFCIIEHTSKKFKVIKPKDNFLIQTNNYLDKELSKEDVVLKEKPENDTYIRYYEILQAINHYKKKLTLNKVKKILDNPKTHLFEKQKLMKTIWTLALDMKNKKYRLYYNLQNKIKHKNLSLEF